MSRPGDSLSVDADRVMNSSMDFGIRVMLKEKAAAMDVSSHPVWSFFHPFIVPTPNFRQHHANTTA